MVEVEGEGLRAPGEAEVGNQVDLQPVSVSPERALDSVLGLFPSVLAV